MNDAHEHLDAALWLQHDAAYLYREAGRYRDLGNAWMATAVQNNAAHSARLARHSVEDANRSEVA